MILPNNLSLNFLTKRSQICEQINMRSQQNTAQEMKFSIKDLLCKFDQIRRALWHWSHLLQKSLMENFIFCAVVNRL